MGVLYFEQINRTGIAIDVPKIRSEGWAPILFPTLGHLRRLDIRPRLQIIRTQSALEGRMKRIGSSAFPRVHCPRIKQAYVSNCEFVNCVEGHTKRVLD